MNDGIFVLYLLNFALIGALPRIFFKKGSLNWRWWLTAAPLFLGSLLLISFFFQLLIPRYIFSVAIHEVAAAVLSFASVSLISFTIGTHRTRLALWHQDSPPESIVTYGAYRYIRHPFYAAFLLALLGAVFLCPHPATIAVFLYGTLILNFTAQKEEQFLAASQFGNEYRQYLKSTGRFWPRVIRSRR